MRTMRTFPDKVEYGTTEAGEIHLVFQRMADDVGVYWQGVVDRGQEDGTVKTLYTFVFEERIFMQELFDRIAKTVVQFDNNGWGTDYLVQGVNYDIGYHGAQRHEL